MARPIKQGLDYFALDVTMNDEAELIEAVHGLTGFAILIKLFQKIYSEGYYIDWQDRDQILFSNRVSVDRNLATSVVSDCIKWGIFSREKFDQYGILTSRRIQEQYFTATYKRVKVIAFFEYLLVDVDGRSHVAVCSVSDVGNGDLSKVSDIRNLATSKVLDDKSTQSKVKESKVKKSKEKPIARARDNIHADARADARPDARTRTRAEPKDGSTQEPVFITLPLNDGSDHPVTMKELERYTELYPAVDVKQDLRNMAGWLESNPAKRKTRSGIRRFITNWLARTQNAGGTKGVGSVNRPFNAIPDRNRIKDDSEYDHPTNINHNPFFQAHMEKIRKGD